jgi:hypothetical protein
VEHAAVQRAKVKFADDQRLVAARIFEVGHTALIKVVFS